MEARDLAGLLNERARGGRPYLEFLRSGSMSIGVFVLDVGAIDGQRPHAEDEVYVVIDGRGRFTAADDTRAVVPGDTIYVPAGVPHRFHDITEQLRLIVVFAPPETTG